MVMETDIYDMSLTDNDAACVSACIGMGIDSHLEAFTDSTFSWSIRGPIITLSDGRKACIAKALDCKFVYHELPILLRRLIAVYNDENVVEWDPERENHPAENLARDILVGLFEGDSDDLPYDVWDYTYEWLHHPNRSNDDIGFRASGLDERPDDFGD